MLLTATSTYHQVDILKDRLGFDGAFNYKEEADLDKALRRLEKCLNELLQLLERQKVE